MALQPLSHRAVIPKPATDAPFRRQHKRFVTPLVHLPSIPGLYEVQTHQGCAHNEQRALHNRHLRDYGVQPTPLGLRLLRLALSRIRRRLPPLYPCSLDTVVSHLNSRKKRLYAKAAESLLTHEVEPRDALVKMFIKPDRYDARVVSTKEPRAIQYRSPRYNLRLQQFLHPLEHAYYRTTTAQFGGAVKGFNSWQRASLYQDALSLFVDPVVLNLDFSKFDAHLHPEVLAEERRFYEKTYHDDFLHDLLGMQRRNKCTTQLGLRYFVFGTRISGDVNTGLGNTLLGEGIFRAWLALHKVRAVPFVDGDDIIGIFERGTVPELDFTAWGMECTAEILEPDQLVHCQSKMVRVGKRYRMVRNPIRAISHGCVTVRNYPDRLLGPLLSAMGHCELACSNGVPILQSWALAQIRISGSKAWDKFDEDISFRAKLEGRPIPLSIDPESRESFANCFGISISDQVLIENYLGTLDHDSFLPARRVDEHFDSRQTSTQETS